MQIGKPYSRIWLVTDKHEFTFVPTFGIVYPLNSSYKLNLAFMWLNVHFRIGFIPRGKKREVMKMPKQLAKVVHPDAGGSAEQFQTLQEARGRAVEYLKKEATVE